MPSTEVPIDDENIAVHSRYKRQTFDVDGEELGDDIKLRLLEGRMLALQKWLEKWG